MKVPANVIVKLLELPIKYKDENTMEELIFDKDYFYAQKGNIAIEGPITELGEIKNGGLALMLSGSTRVVLSPQENDEGVVVAAEYTLQNRITSSAILLLEKPFITLSHLELIVETVNAALKM